MRPYLILFIAALLITIFPSCKKEKIKSCIISSTQATIQGDGSVYMEALIDQDNSVECEYGFCYDTNEGPLLTANSISAIRNGYKISSSFPPAFNASAQYYFRPWGTSSNGSFYGNTITLDSIVGNPKGSGCPLRPNMLETGNHIYAYSSVQKPESENGYLYIKGEINAEMTVNLCLGGTTIKEGTYKTVSSVPLKEGEASISIARYVPILFWIYSWIDKNNTITVTRITEGVYEIVICEASWQSTGTNSDKLSARFIVHT